MHKVKTSWPGFAPRNPSPKCRSGIVRSTRNCSPSRRRSKRTTPKCRTSSSRSSVARCTCCKPATGKRTGIAAVKIACDLVKEKLIDEKGSRDAGSTQRVDAACCFRAFKTTARNAADVLCKGINASPGAAVGKLAFTAEEARERKDAGENIILVRRETSPEDVDGMSAAVGILTSTGGSDQPRRCRGSRLGQVLRRRCRRHPDRRKGQEDQGQRQDLLGRQRRDQRSTARPAKSWSVQLKPQSNLNWAATSAKLMKWADEYPQAEAVRTNADSPSRQQASPRLRCRGYRTVPHRAHVLRA